MAGLRASGVAVSTLLVRVRVHRCAEQMRDSTAPSLRRRAAQAHPHNLHNGSTFGKETSPTIAGHAYERIARRYPVTDDRVRGGAAVDASGSWAVAGGACGTGGPQ